MTTKLASVFGSAGVAAAAIVMQASPDGFWPRTGSGWLQLIALVLALPAAAVAFYRLWHSPVVQRVDELARGVAANRTYCEENATRAERLLVEALAANRTEIHAQLRAQDDRAAQRFNEFTAAVHDRLNGFGQRVADGERATQANNIRMAQYEANAAHAAKAMDDLRGEFRDFVKEWRRAQRDDGGT